VDGDLRIIYAARNDFQDITLLDVGGHRDVYRR
jgi:mRNA-degrading endonuclease YafQ of YafQ-DinJ toxin-antitoxin module